MDLCSPAATASTISTNAELVQQVRDLGPDFRSYALALEQRGELGSARLRGLRVYELTLLFALVPKEHQPCLEACFFGGGGEVAPAEEDLPQPSLAFFSDDESDTDPPGPAPAPPAEGGGTSDGGELFLDLDGDSDGSQPEHLKLEMEGTGSATCRLGNCYPFLLVFVPAAPIPAPFFALPSFRNLYHVSLRAHICIVMTGSSSAQPKTQKKKKKKK
jgi:hypothetical protein